jgi:hypothetical protein
VCEDAVSAPGSGAGEASQFGAVPAVASFQVVDSSLRPGAPFDLLSEGASVLKLAAGGPGSSHPGDGHATHTQLVQVLFDRGQAVPAVSGHRPWWAPCAVDNTLDRWRQLRCVSRVSELDAVIEDYSVGVIDDLRL